MLSAQIDVNTDICLQLFINIDLVGEDDTRKTKQDAIIMAKRKLEEEDRMSVTVGTNFVFWPVH